MVIRIWCSTVHKGLITGLKYTKKWPESQVIWVIIPFGGGGVVLFGYPPSLCFGGQALLCFGGLALVLTFYFECLDV